MKPKDVEKNTKESIRMKSQFLHKLELFKGQGQKLEIMAQITRWVDNNIDKFFIPDPKKTDLANYKEKKKVQEGLLQFAEQKLIQKNQKRNLKGHEHLKSKILDPSIEFG